MMKSTIILACVHEAMVRWRIAAGVMKQKWEPPAGRRREWRRKKPDGTYEYSPTPPKGFKQPKKEEPKNDKQKPVEVKKYKHHVKLDRDELRHILTKGHFSVVSAGRNPSNTDEAKMKPDDEFFHKRHEQLKDALEKKGFRYTEVVGHYGGRESSFMVFHDETEVTPKSEKSVMVHHTDAKELEARRRDLESLGKQFNQDSILHGSGGKNSIVFTTGDKAGKECGGKGWVEMHKAKDFYTDIKMEDQKHTKFNLNVDECFKKGLLGALREYAIAERICSTDNRQEGSLGRRCRRIRGVVLHFF